ncbi:hypothetical protein [Streptomyces triculaminicus]|uniref:hypothetical protein n=1 Tax=Streptomyces triculaminicus TaxID=2816232 RepID=UPI0037D7F591
MTSPRSNDPAALVKVVVGHASVIAALMFYLGAVYLSSFYGYFHLSPWNLGFGFSEFVTGSMSLLTLPVLVTGSVLLLAAELVRLPGPVAVGLSAMRAAVARWHLHLLLVVTGLILILLWARLPPYYGWTAPVTLAVGLLLGHAAAGPADDKRTRSGSAPRPGGVPLLGAGLLLLWAATLGASYLGAHNAQEHAHHVGQWTGVVVLSEQRLSLNGVHEEDLGAGRRHRYRYTGLRRLVEGPDAYYVVPIGWNGGIDPLYVIPKTAGTWVGLTRGS